MSQPALTVGYGVPPIRPKNKRTVVSPEVDDKLGLTDEWTDKPTLKNQIDNPEMWKKDREEVRIFDLAVPAELTAYNELLTQIAKPDTNIFQLQSEVKSFDTTQNWKAFVRLQYVKYRVILKTKDL